jgi:DNA-binding transcriptional regulator YbjK
MLWLNYNTCRGFASMGHMARNDERRSALADAGIRVLAEEGARGLTHRAVDAAASTPRGTASNYFPTRDDLISALVDRIGERLTPDPEVVSSRSARLPDRKLFADYLRDVVRRLSADPHVSLALFELRLEAARRPAVAKALGAWRQRAFQDDVAFNNSSGLPGGQTEIALFHYAIDGLMLDKLTAPIDTGLSVDEAIDELVDRLLR